MAAARKVSAAQRTILAPSLLRRLVELADGGGFAGAVHADHEDHARGGGAVGFGCCVEAVGADGRCRQYFQDLVFQLALQRAGLDQLVLVDLLAQRGQDFFSGAHAEVGAEQRGFELTEQFGIYGAVARKDLFDARGKFRAGLADGVLQAFEECGFGRSEERDHLCLRGAQRAREPTIVAKWGSEEKIRRKAARGGLK